MNKDFQRKKLINAMIYFIRNTNHCHTLKLLKLLNFLDFEYYRQTGEPSLGLHYVAMPMGPVAIEVWEDIKNPPPDLSGSINVVNALDELTEKTIRRVLKPFKTFNSNFFIPREIEIMETLAMFFKELKADDMSELSHDLRFGPWRKVYRKGEGRNKPIPYKLSLKNQPLIKNRPTISQDYLDWEQKTKNESVNDLGEFVEL